jgi:hypothetical protein
VVWDQEPAGGGGRRPGGGGGGLSRQNKQTNKQHSNLLYVWENW